MNQTKILVFTSFMELIVWAVIDKYLFTCVNIIQSPGLHHFYLLMTGTGKDSSSYTTGLFEVPMHKLSLIITYYSSSTNCSSC